MKAQVDWEMDWDKWESWTDERASRRVNRKSNACKMGVSGYGLRQNVVRRTSTRMVKNVRK